MRHEVRLALLEHDALRSTVGAAVRLTVSDREGSPAFGDWRPYKEARGLSGIEPPMRQKDEAGCSI
jgi:23S rRNA A2030 N6-methylase RlmJ